MPEAPAHSEASALRANLIFAGVAAITLGVLIAVVVVLASGGKSHAAPAPRGCLRSWNSDQSALADGRHIALAHHYTEAQVGYMDADGEGSISKEPNGRECVVVFASTTLDPEVEYAGQIELNGDWTPLSAVVAPMELAWLQRAALDGANARPTPEGRLASL
jgi:hypothetical protein